MNKITDIRAQEVLDSRGNPTLLVEVQSGNCTGAFSVPSGASTGSFEALELRDEEGGKSHVTRAIKNVLEVIKPALIGVEVTDIQKIDEVMLALDGTYNKSKLGANAILGVSIASVKTAANCRRLQVYEELKSISKIDPSRKLPYFYSNLINGGMHAKTKLAFQEYMVVPEAQSASGALSALTSIEAELGKIVAEKFGTVARGDEGGYALDVQDVEEPLILLTEAVKNAGYTEKVHYALDVAASSFYDEKKDVYTVGGKELSKKELIEIYINFSKKYPLISIEDPLHENDFSGFREVREVLPNIKIVGDDLTVTNKDRLQKSIEERSIDALIIKPNQIGTITETLSTMALARANGIDCIVSHRSGETNDDFIADLAFAFGVWGLKAGSPVAAERIIKYKRLVKISE